MRTWGKSAVVMLTCTALLALPAAGAAKSSTFRLLMPGPGQTTLGVAQFRFKGEAPRTIKPKLANRAKLGPSYRGLYAVYRKRRGRITTLTFLTLLLRKVGPGDRPARSAARASVTQGDGRDFFLALFFVESGFGPDRSVPNSETAMQALGIGEPSRPPERMQTMFQQGGIEIPPESKPSDLGDNAIDTSHYDDGHSFGWNKAGTKAAIGDWLHLSANNAPYEELIEEIERDIKADLDADGEIGGNKSGGTVDTTVGAPIITSP